MKVYVIPPNEGPHPRKFRHIVGLSHMHFIPNCDACLVDWPLHLYPMLLFLLVTTLFLAACFIWYSHVQPSSFITMCIECVFLVPLLSLHLYLSNMSFADRLEKRGWSRSSQNAINLIILPKFSSFCCCCCCCSVFLFCFLLVNLLGVLQIWLMSIVLNTLGLPNCFFFFCIALPFMSMKIFLPFQRCFTRISCSLIFLNGSSCPQLCKPLTTE